MECQEKISQIMGDFFLQAGGVPGCLFLQALVAHAAHGRPRQAAARRFYSMF